ncbi:hypothetical protein VNO77_02577 [Canavalia gladiata]|uniref:Uncharacterized protein n=1 Tax=Canavalia gladiata TaxID=3824 RepID=A0AAN9MU09_CANGL
MHGSTTLLEDICEIINPFDDSVRLHDCCSMVSSTAAESTHLAIIFVGLVVNREGQRRKETHPSKRIIPCTQAVDKEL